LDAIEAVVGWLGEFMGVPVDDVTYELNQHYYDKTIEPQLLMAQIQLLDRGLIAQSDMRDGLRKAGMIAEDRSDEEIEDEIAQESPLS
jgi:hypothetical protein